MTITETTATATLRGECIGGTGPDLSRYPLLVYRPGEGVRIASNGARAIRVAIDAHLDIWAGVAARHGITTEEAEEAYRFFAAGTKGD